MTSDPLSGHLGWAPTIPRNWQVVPLKFVARMGTGHTPDRNKPEYWENCTIPWVTTPDVTARSDSLEPLHDTQQQISEVGLANSAAVLHPAETVMLSRTASVGYSVRIGRPMATTQAFVTWHHGPDLDPRYLLLVLRAMKPEWERLAYGSTHLTIYMPDLEAVRIPLPPLAEQHRIVEFIEREAASIDAVIDVRQRQQKLIDERQDAVLSACCSYDGPGCISHQTLGGLHPSWSVLPLRRVLAAIHVGVVVNPSSYFAGSGVPFIHGFNVRRGWIDSTGMKFLSRASNEHLQRSRVRAGDVLVVRAGAPGRAAVVPDEYDGANCASVLILRQGSRIIPKFLEAFINSATGRGQVGFSQYGAAQEVISAAQAAAFIMPVPPIDEQHKRVDRLMGEVGSSSRIKSLLNRQVLLLRERRQALITAAVTGQFDVSSASGRGVTDGVAL